MTHTTLQRLLAPLVVLVLAAVMLTALACDDGNGTKTTGAETATVSGPPPGPGIVDAKPNDATEVDATLAEWSIAMGSVTVRAGKVYFLVRNNGPEDAHEFVVIKTDKDSTDLPLEDDRVPEDKVDIVDEIEPFTPNSSASLAVDLKPGKYVLICNVLDNEEGEVESHYKKGMAAALTVQ